MNIRAKTRTSKDEMIKAIYKPKTVFILRGIPGTGKTILAGDMEVEMGFICSPYHFFNAPVGWETLSFHLEHARNSCFHTFIRCLNSDTYDTVIVDDTHVRVHEFRNYIELAKMLGHRVEIHEFVVESIKDFALCMERNIHHCPLEVMLRMAKEWESYTVPNKKSTEYSAYAEADYVASHSLWLPAKKE